MSTPDLIEVVVPGEIAAVEVLVPGLTGGKGNPGIIVSETAPEDPEENDLWVDVS